MDGRLLKIAAHKTGTISRVLVSDRDFMSSQLLAEALGRDRYEAVGISSSELLSCVQARKTQMVVIGADLPSGVTRGLDLASAVHRENPEILIVLLLNEVNRESVINAFRSGARGVFCRREPLTEFLECVDHVGRGGIWTGKTETSYLLEAFKTIPSPSISNCDTSAPLTRRELQAVKCAARGLTNKAIAGELALSEHTVKNYLFRAFEKLGVSSRVELLFYLTMKGHALGAAGDDHLRSHERSGQVSG